MRRLLVCVICLPLGACGVVARTEAGLNYRNSAAEYRTCLAGATNPQTCDRQRLVMEADERVAANLNGDTTTLNANIRNR